MSLISTIMHKNVNVVQATALFSRIFTTWRLEIFVPSALSLWQVSQHAHAHTLLSPRPFFRKWIMTEDYRNGKSTNSLTAETLAQPTTTGSIVDETEPWNRNLKKFSFSQSSTKLHPPPWSSSAVLQTHPFQLLLSQTSLLQHHISLHLTIRDKGLIAKRLHFLFFFF